MADEQSFTNKIWLEASKVLVVGVLIVVVSGVNTFLLQDVYTKGAIDEKLAHERELQKAHQAAQRLQFQQLNKRLDNIQTMLRTLAENHGG